MKRIFILCILLSCMIIMAACTNETSTGNKSENSDYIGVWEEVYYLYEDKMYALENPAIVFELYDDQTGIAYDGDITFEWEETDKEILIGDPNNWDILVKDGNTLLMESVNNEGYDIISVFMKQSEIDTAAIEKLTSDICEPGSLDDQIKTMIETTVAGWAYDYEPDVDYTVSYELPGLEASDNNFVEKDKEGNDVGYAMYEIPLFSEGNYALLNFENGAELKLKITDFIIWDRNIIPKQTGQYESDQYDTKMCVYYNHYWYTDSNGWEEEFETDLMYSNRVFNFTMDTESKHLIDMYDSIICCDRLF